MSLEALATKYIGSAEKVLKNLREQKSPLVLTEEAIGNILRWATDYLQDAKYYKAHGKLETSLTSVALL